MSADYPIPPGFASSKEALRRADLAWGSEGPSRLVGLLLAGRLKAVSVNSKGDKREIGPNYWEEDNSKGVLTDQSIGRLTTGHSRGRPLIEMAGLDTELPTKEMEAAKHPASNVVHEPSANAKKLGGRPKEFDEVQILIEAFRIIYEGGKVKSRAALIKQTLDAMSAKGAKVPSEPTIRPLMKRLVSELAIEFQNEQ